jgi:glycerol-3-phosphate acyltransferase PlsY
MTAATLLLIALVSGYLLGSVPFAVLIARLNGIDIFRVGSGNPGATNVMRALGRGWGYGCFALDAFKGMAAVLAGRGLAAYAGLGDGELCAIAGLLGAILGHSYSLFLRYRGGKGVATTVGGMFALLPAVMLLAALVWLVVFYAWRYVSLASLALGVSLPVAALAFGASRTAVLLCLFLAVLITVRHRANIRRLLAGSENRAGPSRHA